MTTEEKRRQTERIAQAISKLPPETVERLDLIVMGAAMVAPKQAEGKGRGEEMEKTLEDVAKNTTALLADCVEQLSKESGCQAQLDRTVAKVNTCLKILKFTRDE